MFSITYITANLTVLLEESAEAVEKSTFTEITELIAVLVWPLAVVTIILFFRSKIANLIGSISSVEASASGFSMSFQEKLEQVVDSAPAGLLKAAKSSVKVNSKTPQEQLKRLRTNLTTDIKAMARQYNVEASGRSVDEIGQDLVNQGKLDAGRFKTYLQLYQITGIEDSEISQSQIDQLTLMIKEIGF